MWPSRIDPVPYSSRPAVEGMDAGIGVQQPRRLLVAVTTDSETPAGETVRAGSSSGPEVGAKGHRAGCRLEIRRSCYQFVMCCRNVSHGLWCPLAGLGRF